MTDRLAPSLLEIKRHSITDEGIFSGYASTFGGPPDLVGDVIQRGAFLSAISHHKASDTMPAMLWHHDQSEPIGKWLDFTEDQKGLLATGKITLGTKRGKEAFALMKDGALTMSIGFNLAEGGASKRNGIRTITKVGRLGEVSLVAIPANPNAKITDVKKPGTVPDFQQALRSIGFSLRESKFVTTHGFREFLAPRAKSEIDLLNEKIEKLQRTIEAKIL